MPLIIIIIITYVDRCVQKSIRLADTDNIPGHSLVQGKQMVLDGHPLTAATSRPI